MGLQNFVTDVIESIGGVVEQSEYALCHVLIPDAYRSFFQNKTELELAFDYEVAEEHLQSEFVTFGSFILDQILKIVDQQSICTLRFAEFDYQTLANPMKRMADFFEDEQKRLRIIEEQLMMEACAVFQFRIAFVSDEKEEHTEQVWINLFTDQPSELMKQGQKRIVYQSKPLYPYPLPGDLAINQAFFTARESLKQETEKLMK
ncbi:MAG: hypothetical protein ABF651_08510 [Sporolactobacillus sp.]